MVAHVTTVALSGINAVGVDVQVQVSSGMSSFQIVGLPDNAIRESKERVRSAFYALGISLPAKRIIVNLSPADLNKEGSHYDLPVAIGLLIALKILPQDAADEAVFMGELGLDGKLLPVTGVLPAAIYTTSEQLSDLFVPQKNANEAVWAEGINVFGADNLEQVIKHLKGEEVLSRTVVKAEQVQALSVPDMQDVKGQESIKRAAEIAMAGGHNMLMCGCPGSGKSMLAKRMLGLAPQLTSSEALEVSMIHSVAGLLSEEGIVKARPFRDPHHSASAVALCGGGLKAKPGEMSLAHRGILFLDELPEFPRQVLETLRQPLENGNITVSRANHHVTYPAKFQLIAAMNPCPCGYLGHPSIQCSCSQRQIKSYISKLSGPLLDRIDIHVEVPAVDMKKLTNVTTNIEKTDIISERVMRAKQVQQQRYQGTNISNNSEVMGKQLEEIADLGEEERQILDKAGEQFAFSARGYHRILRVARTIADMEGSAKIQRPHLLEALTYRYIPNH